MTAQLAEPANIVTRWALWYAGHGWPVVPLHSITEAGACTCRKGDCSSPGKHPRTSHGLTDASTHETVIRGWWSRWPGANIGITTGGTARLVVLDFDLHGENGFFSLVDLERELGRLPDTVTAKTGGGGEHRLYTVPAGQGVPRNSSGGNGGLAPGVDVRGEGGYIVAPPSLHQTLTHYVWAPGKKPTEIAVAELPEAWVKRLLALAPARTTTHQAAPSRTVGAAGSGRNVALTKLAGAMRRQGADEETLLAALSVRNAHFIEPLAADEVLKIARSVAKYPPATDINGAQPGEGDEHGAREFMHTDLGNAERLIHRHGKDLRYCEPLGGWQVWVATHWQRDTTGEVVRRAIETVRAMYLEAAAMEDAEKRALLAKWAAKSEGSSRIAAMLTLGQAQPGVAVPPEQFDRDPWLLACQNGTYDLRAFELREHRRADLITRVLPVPFEMWAACPTWTAFLDRIMAGDEAMIAFLRRAIGYSLTGDTSERCFFVLHGSGSNGKSTLLETIGELLGDYARTAEASTFLEKNQERVSNDLAMLAGARFVSISEGQSGQRLHEKLIKRVTGRDSITARFLFRENFTYRPGFKLWLGTNHKPDIHDAGAAMWNRVKLVPFEVVIPDVEQDKQLPDKLRAEWPGILAWAIQGCADWRRLGDLQAPVKVVAATKEYRDEQDILGPFIGERCVVDPQAEVKAATLRKAYVEWSDNAGDKPISATMFGIRLGEQGFKPKRVHGGTRVWAGIRLREANETAIQQQITADGDAGDAFSQKSDTFPYSSIYTRVSENSENASPASPGAKTVTVQAPPTLSLPVAEPVTSPPPAVPVGAPPPALKKEKCEAVGCGYDAASDADPETGAWCYAHAEVLQLLNFASALGWPAIDLGEPDVLAGGTADEWRAWAAGASATSIAMAHDELGRLSV